MSIDQVSPAVIAARQARVAAQVAVEAVINDFNSFDRETAIAVHTNGMMHNVPDMYLEMLRVLLYT